MVSSTSKNSHKAGSSFDAFSKVDELVSKPVLGSDGAASWQSFRNDHHKVKDRHDRSAAPKAPLKRADKLGTGFSTWEEERAHEVKIRAEAGHAKTNAGYSDFKKKGGPSAEEAASLKRKAQTEARVRPDDKEYFIPSKTFQGWKFDYIFTTRNDPPRTGYFWDGMDSIKKSNGELNISENHETNRSSLSLDSNAIDKNVNSKLKKKKRRKKGPSIIHDPSNPMEQVQAIIQKRNQQLMGISPYQNFPPGWEAAKDPSTGNTYYFHRSSGKRSWEMPQAVSASNEGDEDNGKRTSLPTGWSSAVDKVSGNTYYHHTSGKTTWEKPE